MQAYLRFSAWVSALGNEDRSHAYSFPLKCEPLAISLGRGRSIVIVCSRTEPHAKRGFGKLRLSGWRSCRKVGRSQPVGATPSDMNSFFKGGVYGTRKTEQAFH